MKLLTILLSFYLFALSAIPCADSEPITSTPSSVSNYSNPDNHSHKDNDLCSPFCVCNCCGQQIVSNTIVVNYSLQIPFETITTLNSFYTSAFHSNFFGSIWQPPQIA